jgi:hypothetical protein
LVAGGAAFTVHLLSAQTTTQEQAAPAEKSAPLGQEWVRLTKDAQGRPQALEVAIVRYVPRRFARQVKQAPGGTQLPPARQFVDLVGAVHVGDLQYYTQLNRRFGQYQALLYELVAPPGTRIQPGRNAGSNHPVTLLQNSMKSFLELEHQLERIDYTRPNFVHADMSPDQFADSMNQRDESFLQLYARMMGQALAQQTEQAAEGASSDLDIMLAFFSEDRARKLKIAIARQFQTMEAALSGLSGPEGSTLITERNKRALAVLRKQMNSGRRQIGIFYGAGHLTDMGERLEKDFNLQPVGIVWLEAWNLREKAK